MHRWKAEADFDSIVSIIHRIMSQHRRQHASLSLATPKGLPGDRGVCMRYRSGRGVPPLGAHLTYRVRKLTSNSSEFMAHAVTSRGLFGKHFDRSLSHRDPFMRSANDLGLKRSRTLSQYTEHPYLQSGHHHEGTRPWCDRIYWVSPWCDNVVSNI